MIFSALNFKFQGNFDVLHSWFLNILGHVCCCMIKMHQFSIQQQCRSLREYYCCIDVRESRYASSLCHGNKVYSRVLFRTVINSKIWTPAGAQKRKAHTYKNNIHGAASCILTSGAHFYSLSICCWYPMRLDIVYWLLTIPLYYAHAHT